MTSLQEYELDNINSLLTSSKLHKLIMICHVITPSEIVMKS